MFKLTSCMVLLADAAVATLTCDRDEEGISELRSQIAAEDAAVSSRVVVVGSNGH